MKISKAKIKKLIQESLVKEFKDAGNFGGINLPPSDTGDTDIGGGDEEPQWKGPQSFWIFKLNPDQTPSNKRIYLSKLVFERIMNIYYKLAKRSESFGAEYFRRKQLGQDISSEERAQHAEGNKKVVETLWQINKDLGGHLIAINSPVAYFNQKYQIHIHASDSRYDDIMELYTVEILSGALSEHDFEEYRRNLWKQQEI